MAVAGNRRNRSAATPRVRLTRRGFRGTAAGAGALLLTKCQARTYGANEQLQVAVVGVGGRGSGFAVEKGWSSVRQQTGGRIAALCDVNKKKAAEAFKRYPDVPKYEDFRIMIAEMGSKLDAVVVATPDHVHAAPFALALRAGLHVFCEKGLTRTIHEARTLAELTGKTKRSTQMGNQAGYNVRVIENVWAGRLGEIQTIHMWVGGGAGLSLAICCTVVEPRCSPARARICAILRLPREGHKALRRWTMYRTKSGNLLTGSRSWTRAASACWSILFSQEAMVVGLTRKALAV
jgi:hypothetical protein